MAWIEEMLEKARKEHCVACPYCGQEHEPSIDFEMFSRITTYHGEEEPQEFQCSFCEERFFVKEWVERTFEAKKTEKEFD